MNTVDSGENQAVGRRNVLESHLGQILERCRTRIESLEALILYGGYGRDEGGWIHENYGWRPYNDYDVVAVVGDPVETAAVEQMRKELAAEIGIHWVDITQMTRRKLAGLKPTILNYDLKYASRVFYGDPAILDLIPEMEASQLPLKEAFVLFKTRLWTFLGSLDKDGLSKRLTGEASRFFRNQMSKALLAAVDVLLLTERSYHPSYRKRVETVGVIYQLPNETVRLLKWALEEKLRPRGAEMSAGEAATLYDSVHNIFLEKMLHALSGYFRKRLSTVDDIARAYKGHWETVVRRIAYPIIRRSGRFERIFRVTLAQMYVFGAYRPERDIDDRMLAKTCNLLRKLDPSLGQETSWNQARLAAARLRLEA